MRLHFEPRASLVALFAIVALSDLTSVAGGRAIAVDQTGIVDRAAFLNPPMETRPAIRWWWPGGDVVDQELVREIRAMSTAGFGSAEIQSFAIGLPETAAAAVKIYGTSAWFDHVGAALNEAQRLGFKIDLTAGSSWPSGSDHVTSPQSLQQLISTGVVVIGPGTFDAPVPAPSAPVRYSLALQTLQLPDTFDASRMTSIAILAFRVASDQTQTQAPGTPVLPNLPQLPPATFLDADSVVDLGPFVSTGRIHWQIPPGAWAVFVFHSGPTGSQPIYGADPNGGLVVDHLNDAAVGAHLDDVGGTAQARFGPQFGTTLRSLFVDSLELRTELYWTDDFPAEFAARRGYRLEPFLPVLFVPLNNDVYMRALYRGLGPRFEFRSIGRRVRRDYDVTVSELMIERFFNTVGTWSAAHGVGSRVQAHGAPVDLLTAYTRASIPETENLYAGGRPSFLKYAASAAHALGGPIVSSEVIAARDGDATLGRIMQETNGQFAAGVNHVVLHGYPYMYFPGFEPRGWMPFQSPYLPAGNFLGTFGTWLNETSPLWRFMPAINARLARTQLVLRQGHSVANVALFTDQIGYPDDPTYNPVVNQQLELSGQNYDYINTHMIGPATLEGGTLRVGPSSTYRALVIDNVAEMQVDVTFRVVQLIQNGLPVVFVGDIPHRQPGYLDAAQNDATVRAMFEQTFGQTREALITQRKVKAGSALFVASAADLPAALANDLAITPDVILNDDRGDIRFAHRRTVAADYYFFTSTRSQAFDTRVTFPHDASRTPFIFDVRTGNVTAAPVYQAQGSWTSVSIRLEPGGATLIGFEPADGPSAHIEATDIPSVTRAADGTILVATQYTGTYSATQNGRTFDVTIGEVNIPPISVPVWELVTLEWSPQGNGAVQSFPAVALGDLSTIPQLAGFTGTAVYSATVHIDQRYLAPFVRVVLNLGGVYDAADIKVNNRLVETLTSTPFTVDVSSYLTLGANRLEIAVATLGSPSGLLGPVSLTPMYQVPLAALPPAKVPSVPFSITMTPRNLVNATDDDIKDALTQAGQLTDHINFQWIWRTPPNAQHPETGPAVGCAQITPWVNEAKLRGFRVILQFQTFVAELIPGALQPTVHVANPIVPFEEGTFANDEVLRAYLDEIQCLARLEPDYLVLGPEVNFVVTFNFPEFQRFVGVYRKAYDIAKTISPWTQVGLSWQYDALRESYPLDPWDYIRAAGPQDFIGLSSYFGYPDYKLAEFPTVTSIPADYYRPIRERFGPEIPIFFTEIGYSSHFANGLTNQADFLKRVPALLNSVRPIGVVWALLHDVQFFGGFIQALNESGLLTVGGSPKPSWHAAVEMKADGRLGNMTTVFASAMPFAVNASPPAFPTILRDDLNTGGIGERGEPERPRQPQVRVARSRDERSLRRR